ncbi:MAG: hypothetical protein ABI658_26610 [Acidimicrobiales bacterium]
MNDSRLKEALSSVSRATPRRDARTVLQRAHLAVQQRRRRQRLVAAGMVGLFVAAGSLWSFNREDRDTVSVVADAPSTTSQTAQPPLATAGVAASPSITATVPVSGGRMPILAAANAVWVGSQSSALVQRIDPATNRITGEVQRSEPTTALADAFGAVWACGPTALDRIDPTTLRVTNTYPTRCVSGLTAGFGSLWVVAGTTVVRLDPATGTEQARIAVSGGTWGITTTTTAVWVADGHAGPGRVSRIDPNTNTVVAEIASPVRTRNLVATDNAVWITGEARETNISVLRLDPATNTIVATFDAPSDATGIARLGDYIWAIGYAGDVAVIDTRTNKVAYHQRLTAPGTILGGDRLAAGFGSIWIGSQQPGLLSRIDPGTYSPSPTSGSPSLVGSWVANQSGRQPNDPSIELNIRADGTFIANDACNLMQGKWGSTNNATRVQFEDVAYTARLCIGRPDVTGPLKSATILDNDRLEVVGSIGTFVFVRK